MEAIERVKILAGDDRYLGAFIFGSVARGETTEYSDLDVKVVTKKENICPNINHPFIGGIKLDITFRSLKQLEHDLVKEHAGGRIPMLAESIIIFDKDGDLAKLKSACEKMRPPKAAPNKYQFIQFLVYHSDDKVRRNLEADPETSLLAMTTSLDEVVKTHYGLQGYWKVSSKRLLRDLDGWDPALAKMVRAFVRTADVGEKFRVWSDIIEHVLRPIGGRQKIQENNCDCGACRADLAALLETEKHLVSGFPLSRE